ncbi:hypothetical protein OOK07_41275 [Streptomyces sp. NBC_00078]|nr:hypothetical protein [Streptomyces sp. NBC_00078]
MANWILVDGDWGLVANKNGTTRLGFSHLLLQGLEDRQWGGSSRGRHCRRPATCWLA